MASSAAADLVVIGAGPAGLSAAIEAERQGARVLLLEAADAPGGLTRSFSRDGYTFDCSGHLLHLSQPDAVDLVQRATADAAWNRVSRNSAIFLEGAMVPYPFQLHLAHAPEGVRVECLEGLPSAQPEAADADGSANFGQWIEETLGAGIGRHFMVPYNEKLSTVGVDELTCEWLGRFVPQPRIDDIRTGARSRRVLDTGYNRSFMYPAEGGISTLSRGLANLVSGLITCAGVSAIDSENRVVSTDDGREFEYRTAVVATAPLPSLAAMIRPLSAEALHCAKQLRANKVTCVNLGLKAANPEFSEYQWIYLPQRHISAYRLGFYGRFSAKMSPEGREGVYVEIAHGPGTGQAEVVDAAIGDLLDLEVIGSADDIDTVLPVRIEAGYVIHDRKTASARGLLRDELERRRIFVAGRYARWEYSAMEDALVQGIAAARRALETGEAAARA